jgi:hypothetical protein
MRNLIFGVSTIVFVMVLSTPMAFAEKSLGKHSQGEVRDACNAGGGELLGVSDLGSYGCEFADQDVLILCNKNQECTAYKAGAPRRDVRRITALFNKAKPAKM